MSFVTVPCTKCGAKLKIREAFARLQAEVRCVKCGTKIAIPKGAQGGQTSTKPNTPAQAPSAPLTTPPPIAPDAANPLPLPPIAAPVKSATANIAPVEDMAAPVVASPRRMVIKPNSGPIVTQPAAKMAVAPVPLPPTATQAAIPVVPAVPSVAPNAIPSAPKIAGVPAPVSEQGPSPTAMPPAQPDPMLKELRDRGLKMEGEVQALRETLRQRLAEPDPMLKELRDRGLKMEGEVQALREALRQRPAEVEALNQKLLDNLIAEINGTIKLWKQELQDNAKLELQRAESLVADLQARIRHLQG